VVNHWLNIMVKARREKLRKIEHWKRPVKLLGTTGMSRATNAEIADEAVINKAVTALLFPENKGDVFDTIF